VTIAVAIAVAFWMTGIVGLFTGFEQVQIISAVPSFDDNNNQFTITLIVKNTGTATASIDNLFINGVPFDNTFNVQWDNTVWNPGTTRTLAPGQQVQITITFADQTAWAGGTLTHGVSVEVKLHTTSGKEYPKLVVLP
jgi:archaellum component FlaG (FlaF/FlaG flagellin family)